MPLLSKFLPKLLIIGLLLKSLVENKEEIRMRCKNDKVNPENISKCKKGPDKSWTLLNFGNKNFRTFLIRTKNP